MADQFENMSDAELNDVIFNSDSGASEDLGESTDDSVSPIIEDSNEQPGETDTETDVDQTGEAEQDSEDDSTEEEETDEADGATDETDDESEEADTTEGETDTESETDEKQSDVATEFQPLRANGKEYPIDSIDELYKMASAGIGAQHKFQAIAGHKKSIMAAQKAGVDIDEAVNFMANYKENPQDAIARLLQDNDIDSLDLQTENISEAKDYSVSDFEVAYDEVVGEIGDSPIFAQVQNVLVNEWDDASQAIFLEDPSRLKNLHEEMSPQKELNGKSLYELVAPIAEKMKLSGDSRSNYDVYMDAREQKVKEFEQFEKTKQSTPTPKAKPNNKPKKKAANPTGGTKAGTPTLDFSAMSDAELDAFLEKAE